MNAIVKGIFLLLALSAVFCVDLDGDGFDTDPAFGRYQDCCDSVLDGCFDPYMVNPGAFEIPNNGILDRCTYDCTPAPGKLQCENLDLESLPCDSNHLLQESYILSGPQITSSDTEPAIWAMDLCEFKDDDDDPSWGFYRQTNAIFALADQRRNGFDIGVIGPDVNQASVLRSFGRIGPVNGDYMLALSSGYAKARYQPAPNNVGALSYDAESQPATLPNVWSTNAGDATNFNCGEQQAVKPTSVEDSILLRFNVVQPSNMNAFSFKVLYMDAEITPATFTSTSACDATQSWFLALKNGTHTPSDHNIAGDKHNFALYSFNPNIDFITQCDDWRGNWPANTCPDSEIRLEGAGYDYASNWIPVGSAADPKEVFELLFITFDNVNPNLDATVLIDDFKVMGEAREPHSNTDYLSTYWGYQYTGDLALVSLIPDVKGLYPEGTKSVSLNFVIRNEGPEIAGDVTIAFTPPFGTKFDSISSTTTTFATPTVFPATGGFEDNSYHKIKLQNNLPLLPHETISGKITFDILTKAPKDIQFRVTVSTSSIDYVWGNNHLLQIVYIDKPLNGIH